MPYSMRGSVQITMTGTDVKLDPFTNFVVLEGYTSGGDGRVILPENLPAGQTIFVTGGDVDILSGAVVVGSSNPGSMAHRTSDGWVVSSTASPDVTVVSGTVQTRSLTVTLDPSRDFRHLSSFNLAKYLVDTESVVIAPANKYIKWDITVIVPASCALFSRSYFAATNIVNYVGVDDPQSFAFRTGEAGIYTAPDGSDVEVFNQQPLINLVNYGHILGGSGEGKEGPISAPECQGTHAILADLPLTIDNRGIIAAGGGGGVIPASVSGMACSGQGYSKSRYYKGSANPWVADDIRSQWPSGRFFEPGWPPNKNTPSELKVAAGGYFGCPGQGIDGQTPGMPGLLADKAENITWLSKGQAQGLIRDTVNNKWELYFGLHAEKDISNLDSRGMPPQTGNPFRLDTLLSYYGYTTGSPATVSIVLANSAALGGHRIIRAAWRWERDLTIPINYDSDAVELRVDAASHEAIISTGSNHNAGTQISIEVNANCHIIGHGASANQSGVHPPGGDAIVVQHATLITNRGRIAGGGGAGASVVDAGIEYVGGSGAGIPNATPSVETGTNVNSEIIPGAEYYAEGAGGIAGRGGMLGEDGQVPDYSGAGTVKSPSMAGNAIKEDGGVATIFDTGTILGGQP